MIHSGDGHKCSVRTGLQVGSPVVLGRTGLIPGTREPNCGIGCRSQHAQHCSPFESDTLGNIFFYKDLFIFRERGREGEGRGGKHWHARDTSIGCLSRAPNWGPGLQRRHVPWLGIEPSTFQFTGQHSIHSATPARAWKHLFICEISQAYKHTYIPI